MNAIDTFVRRNKKLLAYGSILLVTAFAIYWCWQTKVILGDLSDWCINESDSFPLDACGAIAERDIWSTYYLKVLTLSVFVFGSTSLLLAISRKEDRG